MIPLLVLQPKELGSPLMNKYLFFIPAIVLVCITGRFFFQPVKFFEITPYSPVIFAQDGSLLSARIASDGQYRFPCSNEVNERYKIAVIAQEDNRFYYHPGVDPFAIMRAFFHNVFRGEIISGGSTITMQMARIERGGERTLYNKVSESLLALLLEIGHSKKDILAQYSCHVPMGGNIVGIETAAWAYFLRAPQDLSWAESALLSVLPNNPSLIHLGKGREKLKIKRDRLISRLEKKGYLSKIDAELAIAEPLPAQPKALPRYTPHLLDTLAGISEDRLFHKPFLSTINKEKQILAGNIFNRYAGMLKKQGVGNAAMIIIENDTGEVKAYIGNNPDSEGGAIDIVRSERSTGSILKPFLYASMMESGIITPQMLVPDIPTMFEGYEPENFDHSYRGAVTASQALAASLNVPAVRLLKKYGVARFRDELVAAGLTTVRRSADNYGLSLILGGAEATLFELSGIYSAMARMLLNEEDISFVSRPVVLQGEKIIPNRFFASRGSVWLVFESLVEANRPDLDSFWRVFTSNRKIAWKTGTSIGMRDAWAIGADASWTVGVWAGNADGSDVSGLTGMSVAAPLMFEIFRALPSREWFKKPSDLKQLRLCAESGLIASEDCPEVFAELPEKAVAGEPCQYHHTIHLSRSGNRVHSGCADVGSMKHEVRFVLPPVLEYYYRNYHPEYKMLPPWEKGCQQTDNTGSNREFGIVYPAEGAKIYIPVTISGEKGKVVLRAVHRSPNSTIYWHLDGEYIGKTTLFHEVAVDVEPGKHNLTIVDQSGGMAQKNFTVLGEQNL